MTDTTLPPIRCGAQRCAGHALPSEPRPHPSGIEFVEYRCNVCPWTAVEFIRPARSILDTAPAEFPAARPAGEQARPPGRRDRTGERIDDTDQFAIPAGRSGRLPS